jgi:hypothetical protein
MIATNAFSAKSVVFGILSVWTGLAVAEHSDSHDSYNMYSLVYQSKLHFVYLPIVDMFVKVDYCLPWRI